MSGLQVFTTVAATIRAGFEVYDRTEYGWLLRIRLASGLYAQAIVDLR